MIKGNGLLSKAQEKLGELLKPLPVTPDQLTIMSVIIAFIGLYFFIQKAYLPAALLYGAALLIDAVDGALARAKSMATAKGAFLDGIADRFVEFAILIGLAGIAMPTIFFPSVYWVIGFLFFGTCMTSFVKAYADHRQAVSHEEAVGMKGIFERGERVAVLIAIVAMVAANQLAIAGTLLAAGTILAMATVWQRCYCCLYHFS